MINIRNIKYFISNLLKCILILSINFPEVMAAEQSEHFLHPNSNLPLWLIGPFFVLLAMIATGPILYPKFWHKFYTYISITLAAFISIYYLLIIGDSEKVIHAFHEY